MCIRDSYKDSTDGWVKIDTTTVGSVVIWPGNAIPDNWLLCDGSLLQRTDYPALFAVCGILYGTVSSTDFRIPNLKGIYPMGQGQQDIDGRTKGYIDDLGTVKEDQMQELSGSVKMNQVYPNSNLANTVSGIFSKDTGGASIARLEPGIGSTDNQGFRINLDAPTEPIRRGEYNHPSSLLMHFIIKAI